MSSGVSVFCNIIKTDTLSIDFFQPTVRSGRLVCTFTTFNNRSLEGMGFGGVFALSQGFDVIAVKSTVNDFYQHLLHSRFDEVQLFLANSGHFWTWRATYGSSMGAYAAIHLALPIDANAVLALSPRFNMMQTRANWWRSAMSAVDQVQELRRDAVASNCHYVIAYDPLDADRVDVGQYEAIIPSWQLTKLAIPYAGHPVSNFLKEAGVLKEVVIAALTGVDLPEIDEPIRAARLTNAAYLGNLSAHCFRRGKFAWAYSLACHAVGRGPSDWNRHLRASQASEALGDVALAKRHALDALAIAPKQPQVHLALARISFKEEESALALHYATLGLELAPGNPQLTALKINVAACLADHSRTQS